MRWALHSTLPYIVSRNPHKIPVSSVLCCDAPFIDEGFTVGAQGPPAKKWCL